MAQTANPFARSAPAEYRMKPENEIHVTLSSLGFKYVGHPIAGEYMLPYCFSMLESTHFTGANRPEDFEFTGDEVIQGNVSYDVPPPLGPAKAEFSIVEKHLVIEFQSGKDEGHGSVVPFARVSSGKLGSRLC